MKLFAFYTFATALAIIGVVLLYTYQRILDYVALSMMVAITAGYLVTVNLVFTKEK